ncbi:MAG: NAD(P)H-dependent oxidoreductase, partial [Clostridiales bacterium]|nr:NAD(P)H-dependent oxidoreductase [Clostridiales bacterium]
SRANREMNDETSRPALKATVENVAQYDTILLGFPIWWGQAPRLIETFIEAHDLSGKTILPFCTSGGSGYGQTDEILAALTAETVTWLEGRRFPAGATVEEIAAWLQKMAIEPYAPSEEE